MVKHLFYFSFILFISCSSQPEKKDSMSVVANNQTTPTTPVVTPNFSTQFFLVDSLNPKQGFGYNILVDGTLFIHQASIPAIPGNISFSSKEKAESVANLVIHKLQHNIMPPSVSKQELDSLNIFTPSLQ